MGVIKGVSTVVKKQQNSTLKCRKYKVLGKTLIILTMTFPMVSKVVSLYSWLPSNLLLVQLFLITLLFSSLFSFKCYNTTL